MSLVGFQQRMSNYPFEGTQGCTVYITLDAVPLETALKVVVGSHLWNKTFFPDGFDPFTISDQIKEGQYERIPDIRTLNEAMIRETNLFPGDIVIYNMKCVVSTNGNATHHPQRALALHFLGDDVRFVERPWPINPPITGNLKVGDHPSRDSATFPTVFTAERSTRPSTNQPAHTVHNEKTH
ncbi:hypothetical protein RvY_02270 [Ramazzottius varieornatus]|uniref:Uncharacterized protein n=1 Tax=Ramazzottius varieornatus TaxID=947166 RepID=A0A1D1UJ61_RAMVA|nr:hypothetical protein RvY_02270 [Ramazzottius varieornatus]